MVELLSLPDRSVHHLPGTSPAVFYLADRDGGGILINSPRFDPRLLAQLILAAPLNFIFYPSRFGAADVDAWRAASGAKTMAWHDEVRHIEGVIDLPLSRENRFSRTIDFLPMSGRTEGSCALRCKNKPGIVFFGPILECGASGWPTLLPHTDDYSFENRLIGALGLQSAEFDYAFSDDFDSVKSRYGPQASQAIRAQLSAVLGG